MTKLWCALAVLFVALAAGQALAQKTIAGDYPQDVITAIEADCARNNIAAANCACITSRVQAEISYAEFGEMGAALSQQRLHPAQLRWETILGQCQPVSSGPRALAGSGYTDLYVQNFMRGCNEGGASLGHCACSVERMQRLIPFEQAISYDNYSSWGRGEEHPRAAEIMAIFRRCAEENPQ